MTSICVIKMIDNHLYIPTTRLHKEKRKRKGSDYRVYPPLKFMCYSFNRILELL